MNLKPTKEQIESAVIKCLTIQCLTSVNLLDDVILTLSNDDKRAFLANYSDLSLETQKSEFNKELKRILDSMSRRKVTFFDSKKKVWFLYAQRYI